MIKHLIDSGSVDEVMGLTACGALRIKNDPKQETRAHKKVTCPDCKYILKERKVK